MKEKNKEYLDFALEIAKYAKETMNKYYNMKGVSSYKGDRTIVTLADKEINTYLIEKVKEKYPNHSVDGEEEQFGEGEYVWVCDPVDGTAMYARHIPVAVFSLGLCINGESVVGVVYDPFNDELYSAVKGGGAYKNGEKISVNDYDFDDMRSIINNDMWADAGFDTFKIIDKFAYRTYTVGLGSAIHAAICVANGSFVASLFPGVGHKNCDCAAVKVIVEEAGGKVTNFYGEDQRYDKPIKGCVFTNGKVHDELIGIIKETLFD